MRSPRPTGKDAALLDSIFAAATQPLVLIAPRGNDGYGFDVRSLQELMAAAMHLTSGPLNEVIRRLRRATASPHWRNTWIFAAGRLFAIPQSHQHEAMVSLVESADEGAADRLGDIAPIGPRLALEIIDDGMARSLPRWRARLISHGLRVLSEPIADDLPGLVRVVVRFADTGDEQRTAVAEGLCDALGGDDTARATAERVQAIIPAVAEEVGASAEARGLVGVRKRPSSIAPAAHPNGWDDFDAEVISHPVTGQTRRLFAEAANAIRRIEGKGAAGESDTEAIVAALANADAAKALAVALAHVVAHEPVLVRAMRDDVPPSVHRRLIGDLLGG
jgi:hypothetical protein